MNNELQKKCWHCKQVFEVSNFYKDKSRPDGLQGKCKPCVRAAFKVIHQTDSYKVALKKRKQTEAHKAKHRQYIEKYRAANQEKVIAQRKVHRAVIRGLLPKPSTLVCICGEQARDYHHESYKPEHWLDVIAVCRKCHSAIHSAQGAYT